MTIGERRGVGDWHIARERGSFGRGERVSPISTKNTSPTLRSCSRVSREAANAALLLPSADSLASPGRMWGSRYAVMEELMAMNAIRKLRGSVLNGKTFGGLQRPPVRICLKRDKQASTTALTANRRASR